MMRKLVDINIEDVDNSGANININKVSSKDIAVIGMHIHMPMANNLDDFWANLRNGMDCVRSFPENRKGDLKKIIEILYGSENAIQYKDMSYLDDIDKFDNDFFNITPKEAALMDPNQRIFLETAWGAIENAGYGGEKIAGSKTGVYVGFTVSNEYQTYLSLVSPSDAFSSLTGNLSQLIASRLSYLLDLGGASVLMDTTCSSSLVAVHEACQALRTGDCDMAIAGSVKIHLLPKDKNDRMPIESLDGRTRAFDESSDGTGWGEGAAAILIKPLNKAVADGDNIYAVIKGSAINQDGRSNGITAPNPLAQEKLIKSALKDAEVDPDTITYIEAHGTGTRLGDPIEIEGITRAFSAYTDRKRFCGIGSVKTNLGHLGHAAGIAGLIKAVLSLKHGEMVPSLHFKDSNTKIDFANSPVYVVDKLTRWETAGILKRCGVSSFGMGGTNCHVILEEAPANCEKTPSYEEGRLNVLTISAKKEKILKELVNAYEKLLENQDLNAGDLCFTANTGRGHYSHRLAIIFRNVEELREKIRGIGSTGPDQINDSCIFYNVNRVVNENKGDKKAGEITEKEIGEYSEASKAKIKEFAAGNKKNLSLLKEVCGLYVKGAAINWNELYRNEKRKKAVLPTYPFERKRCWIETASPGTFAKIQEKPFSSLIDKRMVETFDQTIFSTKFSPSEYWVLNEHRMGDNCVLVGTAYVEMALEAAAKSFPDSAVELRDMVFLSPLVIRDGEEAEVHTVIKKEQDAYAFTIASRKRQQAEYDREQEWVIHTQGRIIQGWGQQQAAHRVHIDEIKSKCKNSSIKPQIAGYERFSTFDFGPRWDNIKLMELGENEAFSTIELSQDYHDELKNFILYPSLLDNSLVNALWQGKDLYLPFAYKSIKVYGPTPAKFYSHIKMKPDKSRQGEIIVYDICLINEKGEVFVEIEDYSRKRVHNYGSVYDELNIFYKIHWVLDRQESNSYNPFSKGGVVIIGDNAGIGHSMAGEFRNAGRHVFEVALGSKYRKGEGNQFEIDGSAEDYSRLFIEIKNAGISQIIHTASIDENSAAADLEQLEAAQTRGVYDLFNMVKALSENCANDIEIVLVSRYVNSISGEEDVIKPENAALFGLGKVIGQEYPNIKCRCIDTDKNTTAGQIISEVQYGANTYQVAYRNKNRYAEEFGRADIESYTRAKMEIRQKGVYVITGGTGGIGLELCRYLAKRENIILVLIGRRSLPEKDQWNNIINQGSDIKTCNILKTIMDIEESGSVINYYSSDISDMKELEKILTDTRKRFGSINGVVHCAGISEDGFIIKKDRSAMKRVLAPKVNGTWVLDRLTQEDPLDFFIMFSSLITATGAPGQGDYTAANSYLDAFSAYRTAKGKTALTINWAGWENTGMAERVNTAEKKVFKSLTTGKAVKVFDEILNRAVSRLIVGEINFDNENVFDTAAIPLKLSDEIRRELSDRSKRTAAKNPNPDESQSKVLLKGREDGEYTDTEIKLGHIYIKALGFEEIDIYDDFYDMGGDSLSALDIVNDVNKTMGVKVKITDLFEHLTLERFAGFIEGSIDESASTRSTKAHTADKIYWHNKISSVEEKEYYAVSAAQRRLFVINRTEGDKTGYNMPVIVKIEGRLDFERLKKAFATLIQRHEALRTSFREVDGQPVQRIHSSVNFDLEYRDIAGENGGGAETTQEYGDTVKKHIDAFIRPFDLEKAPLFRAELLKLSEDSYVLMYDFHHIISDGISMDIFRKELVVLYNRGKLPEIKISFKDFAIWQNNLLESKEYKEHERYWLEQFNGEITTLNLMTDYPRPPVPSYEGRRERFRCNSALRERLNAAASATGTTLYMLLLASLNILLSRYLGQEDIIVGSPVSGRVHADLENTMGMFVNTLALRNYPRQDLTVKQFLSQVRERSIKAYEHQDYQFDQLVDKLGISRELSHNLLFDVMLVLLAGEKEARGIAGVKLENFEYERSTSKFDLTLRAIEDEVEIAFELEYSSALFKKETIMRMAVHYLNILDSMANGLDKKLSEVEMLGKEEKAAIVLGFNKPAINYAVEGNLAADFEEQVRKTPDNTALAAGYVKLTYRQLNERADGFAGLLKDRGVGRDSIVAVMAQPSIQTIVSILGIIKAGGAFLPIDAETPEDRLKYILKDSRVQLLLTDCVFDGMTEPGIEVIDTREENPYTGGSNSNNIDRNNIDRDGSALAYVIYTSGTTGMPKGVQIEDHSLINYVNWFSGKFGLKDTDKTVLLSSISFDLGYTSVFPSLLNGCELHLVNKELYTDIEELSGYISGRNISFLKLTPSLFNLLANNPDRFRYPLEALRLVVLGGEPINPEAVEKFHNEYPHICFLNHYGPTEATIGSIAHLLDFSRDMDHTGKSCIGKPIDNARVYILDANLNPVPVGIPGEIHIAGQGLARGYLNNQELTLKKFINSPFADNEKLYKTGDMGKYLEDGNIEFIGRMDNQVKIRGFRVELREVENQLIKIKTVKEASVVNFKDENGNNSLCAYFIADRYFSVPEIRDELARFLPGYMIPSYFVQLEHMPLLPNGKVDVKSLPKPDSSTRAVQTYEEPSGNIEKKLAEAWQEVLGIEKAGARDNFFEAGGDSIKAIQISSRLRKHGLKIQVRSLMYYPTIREQACYVEACNEIDQSMVEGEVILTPIQRQFFEERKSSPDYYNQAVMLYGRRGFDESIVKKVFQAIICHHDALRMVFKKDGNKIIQKNRSTGGELYSFKAVNLCNDVKVDETILRKSQALQRGFDLENGPLVKLCLFKTAEGDHLLVIIHHLVMDGISWRILFEDFTTGYAMASENKEIQFQSKSNSYKEWSFKLKEYAAGKSLLKEMEYWRSVEEIYVKPLPRDFFVQTNKVRDEESISVAIPKDLTELLLSGANRAYNTETNDILLTALGLAFKEWTGENRILLSMEGHGRNEILEDININRTIGWFTSRYPVVLDIAEENNLPKQIKLIKENMRKIPSGGIGYGILKYLTPAENLEDIRFGAKPEISFNYLGQFDEDISTGIFTLSKLPFGSLVSPDSDRPYIFSINGYVEGSVLNFTINYNKFEYNKATVISLMEYFKNHLQKIILHCSQKQGIELTPSDLGNNQLSLEEVDYISSLFNNM